MSTVVAPAAPVPAFDRNPSPRSYPVLAPMTAAPSIERGMDSTMHHDGSFSSTPHERTPPDGKRSPRSARNSKPIVKKEPPSSPSLQSSARHRPRKLDLNTNTASAPPALSSRPSATPLTAREGLVMQDVGLACLSPGFQTHDPTMREQLQRSISVRDQQRSIIEQRLLKTAKGDGPDSAKGPDTAMSLGKQNSQGAKKRPPPGLSIVPPPAEQFANERVVQSAPLHHSFTGRNQPHPPTRQFTNQPSNLSSSSHVQHVPAIQTNNRLPPISDVFGSDTLNPGNTHPGFYHSNSNSSNGPPLPSPGFPPQTAHPMSQVPQAPFERPREYRSAEEAVHEMTGGREDLLPRIVHYGGHQPPTPPSPHPRSNEGLTPHKYQQLGHVSGPTSRRRSRNEYEADSSPPLGSGREKTRPTGPFGEGRDSPATQRAKKEEFLSLCSRAWDLFHS